VANRRVAWSSALLAGLLLAGCSRPSSSVSDAKMTSEARRKRAPEFALKDADGRTVRLADYNGKVVLLNFWATWCGPCKIEIPWFVEFERKYKDRGFAVIGVSMDDDGWESIKPFSSHMNVNYRVLLGDNSTAELYGGVEALPTSFLIDREGRIASVHVGLVSKKEYEHGIEQLLETAVGGAHNAHLGPVPAFAVRAN
jgi:peroxiredoxin